MDPAFRHQRDLHEATNDVLCDLEGLVNALDIAHDAHPTLSDANPASSAIFSLTRLIWRTMDDLRTARAKEWVALGGTTEILTDAEIAAARPQ